MKLFNELLGFVVLTGPLWLIVLTLLICIVIVIIAGKRFKATGLRLGIGLSVFTLAFLILFGDEVAGRVYLNYLCSTQAGVKVYQTVELPAEYWDEMGRARFYVKFDSLLGKNYSKKYNSGTYSSFFNIDNAGYAYSNTQFGQVLGEAIDFMYWGGWMRRNLSPHNAANSCIDYSEPLNRLIDRIFIREESKSN